MQNIYPPWRGVLLKALAAWPIGGTFGFLGWSVTPDLDAPPGI
jgi:hypothetical protein